LVFLCGLRALCGESILVFTMNGLLVLDKPGGITSRDAVDRAQRWFPRGTKLGHTGTLDPLATGVLVLCVGAATRLADLVQAMGKTYRTRVRLGATSDTDDADGTVTPTPGAVAPSEDQVRAAVTQFIGEIQQVPPAYSAMKVTGRRAYAMARRGEEVSLAARPVRVYRIDVLHYEYPALDLEIDCGKGTYIRSIARDLGADLGCGGYVEVLRRTRVGPFRAEDGLSPDADAAAVKLLPMALAAAELPAVQLDADGLRRIRQGQPVRAEAPPGPVALFAGDELVAVGEAAGGWVRPAKVLGG
jgi:tRNA pseudouridine55 synthase